MSRVAAPPQAGDSAQRNQKRRAWGRAFECPRADDPENMMADAKSLEEKIDELTAVVAALSAFIAEIPDAKHVEMPKLKAAINESKTLSEAQKKVAIDAARELKHAVQAKADH
jgi:peptidoglycan hydrolase CwlO-like protein